MVTIKMKMSDRQFDAENSKNGLAEETGRKSRIESVQVSVIPMDG